jgi:hypothetical protein
MAGNPANTKKESWRHGRPKVASIGRAQTKPVFKDAGDRVASGIAVANRMAFFTTLMSTSRRSLEKIVKTPDSAERGRPRPGKVP